VAAALAESQLKATVNVLDDGFQHRSMRRDVDIVAVTSDDLKGRRMPFGRLRESPSALRRADAIVMDGTVDAGAGFGGARNPSQQLFTMTRHLDEAVSLDAVHSVPASGSAVVAVAGIAQPDRFSRALEQAGWRVARLLGFRDHYRYSTGDVRQMERAVQETGAAGVLTTEKDAMRLRAASAIQCADGVCASHGARGTVGGL
jgi:tetraacyldisaccharide 4'-kinase